MFLKYIHACVCLYIHNKYTQYTHLLCKLFGCDESFDSSNIYTLCIYHFIEVGFITLFIEVYLIVLFTESTVEFIFS